MVEAAYPVTTVDLLRHGECSDGNILRGTTDSPLSDAGWRQMTAALTPHSGWQQIVTSPLRRCRDFAETFAAEQRLPIAVIPELQEIHFGDWEGQNPETLQKSHSEPVESYYRDPSATTPPNGESLQIAEGRFANAWAQLLADYRGKHLLAVVHGGTIRILLSLVLQAPLANCQRFAVPQGCLTRLTVYHTSDGHFPKLTFHRPELPCSHG